MTMTRLPDSPRTSPGAIATEAGSLDGLPEDRIESCEVVDIMISSLDKTQVQAHPRSIAQKCCMPEMDYKR
jgi:hypothetical protein